jgi:hypothetical protein
MSHINLKSTTRAITIAASLLCIASGASYFKSEGDSKNVALTIAIASGMIGVTNHFSTLFLDKDANYKVGKIIDKHNLGTARLSLENDIISKDFKNQSVVLESCKSDLKQAREMIDIKNVAIQGLSSSLEKIQNEYKAKILELDAHLATEDTRYLEGMQFFKQTLIEDISNRIYEEYNRISSHCKSQIEKGESTTIETVLTRFLTTLESTYNKHCEMLVELSDIETTNVTDLIKDCVQIYAQINEEICILRVRYQKSLSTDIRRNLEDAYISLNDIKDASVPKTYAKSLLDEQSDNAKSRLSKIDNLANENQNTLEEMRLQVSDFINSIELRNLEIMKLKEEIARLKLPLIWQNSAGSKELSKGNEIINYFWQLGLRLDRAFTTGDVYECKAFFHTDNNARTLNFKELNEHSEGLQQLLLTHKPVSFES